MSIPDDDRGFTLGDGLFETVLARTGDLVLWERHMDRLVRGCATLGLPAPDAQACREAALRGLDEAGLLGARAAVRLSWTAGSGGRGLDRPAATEPRLSVVAAPSRRPSSGAALVIVSVRRNQFSPTSRLKTLSYLDQVMARREALAHAVDDAVMLNGRGELACCAAANLFWLQRGVLFTPALWCGALDGVMRGVLIERARDAGYAVREVDHGPEVLADAEAVMMTNSLIGVREVAAVGDLTFPSNSAAHAVAALVEDVG